MCANKPPAIKDTLLRDCSLSIDALEAERDEQKRDAFKWFDEALKQRARAEASESALREALGVVRPLAEKRMPCLRRTLIAYNSYGLRCLMSPMEIAQRDARAFIEKHAPAATSEDK